MTREELKKQIKYLEDKLECCTCSKEELYELSELKDELEYMESRGDYEEENN